MGKKKRRALRLVICMVIIAAGTYIFNSDLLVDKVYGTIEWNADALLVCRTGSGQGTLITDPSEIAELQNSYEWTNFHLECCVGVPNFWIYVYQDGEPVTTLWGYDNPKSDAYNRAYSKKLYDMGQRTPNVWVDDITIPSGIFTEDLVHALPSIMFLPQRPEERHARGPYLTATYVAFFDQDTDMGKAAENSSPLSSFVADDIFLPLQQALQQEGILRGTSNVRCTLRSGSLVAGETYYERTITFYLTGKPSFEEYGSLSLEYSAGREWYAFIVSSIPLTETDWKVLTSLGVSKTEPISGKE